MKTSTLKKVLSIVIVSVVLALVAVTIILAVVPKKFGNPISTDYVTISVHKDGQKNRFEYHDGATEANFVKNNKIFKEIGRLHEESLKDTLLSAIFQGTGTFKIDVVQDPKGDALGEVSTGYGLIFNYLQPQTLKVDGKELKYEEALSSRTITYTRIVMPLIDSNRFEEGILYLTNDSAESTYQVKYIAHQSELCDYIDSIEDLLY